MSEVDIREGGLADSAVLELLRTHLATMQAQSPPESVHALPIDDLKHPSVRFWHVCRAGDVVAVGALKRNASTDGEIKSMHTAEAARGQGIAMALLDHIVGEAQVMGLLRLFLETGSSDEFAPARELYARYGFRECGPFADYALDPFSTFMTMDIDHRKLP